MKNPTTSPERELAREHPPAQRGLGDLSGRQQDTLRALTG